MYDKAPVCSVGVLKGYSGGGRDCYPWKLGNFSRVYGLLSSHYPVLVRFTRLTSCILKNIGNVHYYTVRGACTRLTKEEE